MKLNGRDLARLIAQPDPKIAGVLIYGADAMRVALKRQALVAAIIGPDGDAEMRLERMPASDLRRDGAQLRDAIKAQGFFPGPRVVLLEDATDQAADPVANALADWQDGDARIVVTAGALKPGARLRKLFEGARAAAAAPIYDDPPTSDEIEAALTDAGLGRIDPDALRDLQALARQLDPGDFRQTAQKIALYKHDDPAPLSAAEVTLLAPASTVAAVDDLLHAVADGQTAQVGPLMVRLQGQGVTAVTLAIMAMRHFRSLHALSCDPGGPAAGIKKLKPPVFGPRRDRLLRQAQTWGPARLDTALATLTDADLTLRSASNAPAMAVIERALIRLAMMARR